MAAGCNVITGNALIRRSSSKQVEYREETGSDFTFDELFNHKTIGRTASADNSLSGCLFSFSYGPQRGGRPDRAGLGQDDGPTEDEQLEAQKKLILQKYRDYLNSYTDCPLSQIGELSPEKPVKALVWGEVGSVAEVRGIILSALERLGIPCGGLRTCCEQLEEIEELTGPLVKRASAANASEESRDRAQELLSEEAKNGAEYLLSFEEELKKAEGLLSTGGHSLRFLFFAPQAEYQKIRSYGCFLPQQIRSVLCVTGIRYGEPLEFQHIRDNRLEEIIETSMASLLSIDIIIYSLERDTSTSNLKMIQRLKQYRDRLYRQIEGYKTDGDNQKEKGGLPPNRSI